MAKREIDWVALKRDYETGQYSDRELGRQYGCSHVAVGKAAKGDPSKGIPPWAKRLAGAVKRATEHELMADAVPAPVVTSADPAPQAADDTVRPAAGATNAPEVTGPYARAREGAPTDAEIVEHAAKRAADVVREHRKDVGGLRKVIQRLGARLERELAGGRVETTVNSSGQVERIEIPWNLSDAADVADKLARSLARVIPLERAAFNIDGTTDPDDAGAVTSEQVRRMAAEVLASSGDV